MLDFTWLSHYIIGGAPRVDKRDVVAFLRSFPAKPRFGLLTVPGQTPGAHVPEHDTRVDKTLEVWDYCFWSGITIDVIHTTGLPDRNGLKGAEYLGRQFKAFAAARYQDSETAVLRRHFFTGEAESAYTAESFLLLKDNFYQADGKGRPRPLYDAIGLVTNTPHLRVALVYARRFLPGIRIIGISSGDGRGALNMPYKDYRRRERKHLIAARFLDWNGRFIEVIERDYGKRLRAQCREKEWPSIRVPT